MQNKTILSSIILTSLFFNFHATAEGDVGFLNIINGTGKPVALSINGAEANPSFAHGAMTGGLVVPAGSARISAKIEGLKDESEPLKIEKDKSNLAVILVEPNQAEPPEEVIKIEPLDYKIRDLEGYSAGLIYVGSSNSTTITTTSGQIFLKKYKYQDMGKVTPHFAFRAGDSSSFVADFREPLHYTLVLLDGSKNGRSNVVVVPHVVFSKPTFN